MSELDTQLLSVKLTQFAGESGGHDNESAINEKLDNEIDEGVKKITLLVCPTNMCWAILGNGKGIKNIQNLWGAGAGIKIKSGEKIGNKLAGEFASSAHFGANRTMYFSRCKENENSAHRVHQQKNAHFHKMIQVIKTPNIDLVEADKIITTGPNRLVRLPEPDSDKFDQDNVKSVLDLFKNNQQVKTYFDTNQGGMLKVYAYEQDNIEKFNSFIIDLPKILDKMEFLTYNTIQGFKGDRFLEFINVDNGESRIINKDTCKENFILGKNALINDDADDDDDDDCEFVPNNVFGDVNLKKSLYLSNNIYEHDNKKHNICEILNFDETFLISDAAKKRLTNNNVELAQIQNICKVDNFVANIPILLSFVDEEESKAQLATMSALELDKIKNLTHESLKQVYIYYHGRYLSKCKLTLPGIQERSLGNFRICVLLNDSSARLVNIRAQKSSVSLETADKIVTKTLLDIVKPILNCFSSTTKLITFNKGVDNFKKYKTNILSALGIAPPPLTIQTRTVSAPVNVQAPLQNILIPPVQQPAINQVQPAIIAANGAETHPIVSSELNKARTIQELKRIKNKVSGEYLTKAQKNKLLTKLYAIEREIILEDDILDEKILELIATVSAAENKSYIKNASELLKI